MNNPLYFFRDLLRQQAWVILWVNWLMLIGLASLFFIGRMEANLVLAVVLASLVLILSLYAKFGYQKILGLGHVLWVPALIYLGLRIPALDPGLFRTWLIAVTVSYGVSLLLDAYDVWVYFKNR